MPKELVKKERTRTQPFRFRVGPTPPVKEVLRIPTGWHALDELMLSGGIPLGIVGEIGSEDGGGKTLTCARILGNAQKLGLRGAWVDAECYIRQDSVPWLALQGMNVEETIIFGNHPEDSAEEIIDNVTRLLRASEDNPHVVKNPETESEQQLWADVVVIDSITALQPESLLRLVEAGKSIKDYHRKMELASILGDHIPTIAREAAHRQKLFLFCNQVRERIGARMKFGGHPEVYTPGGRTKRHHTDLRLFLRRTGFKREGNRVVGQTVECRIDKNRIGRTGMRTGVETDSDLIIWFDGRATDHASDLFEIAVDLGVIAQRAGGNYLAWFTGVEHRERGKDNVVQWIRDNNLEDPLQNAIREHRQRQSSWTGIPSSQHDDEQELEITG